MMVTFKKLVFWMALLAFFSANSFNKKILRDFDKAYAAYQKDKTCLNAKDLWCKYRRLSTAAVPKESPPSLFEKTVPAQVPQSWKDYARKNIEKEVAVEQKISGNQTEHNYLARLNKLQDSICSEAVGNEEAECKDFFNNAKLSLTNITSFEDAIKADTTVIEQFCTQEERVKFVKGLISDLIKNPLSPELKETIEKIKNTNFSSFSDSLKLLSYITFEFISSVTKEICMPVMVSLSKAASGWREEKINSIGKLISKQSDFVRLEKSLDCNLKASLETARKQILDLVESKNKSLKDKVALITEQIKKRGETYSKDLNGKVTNLLLSRIDLGWVKNQVSGLKTSSKSDLEKRIGTDFGKFIEQLSAIVGLISRLDN